MSRHARMTRTAISPRLATRILRKTFVILLLAVRERRVAGARRAGRRCDVDVPSVRSGFAVRAIRGYFRIVAGIGLSNDSPADRVEDDLGGAVEIELFHDARAVGFDGARADGEDVGDFLVR